LLVSGASFLTGVILIRALGLEAFGVYALILVALQFTAGVQEALILNPMMSLFDQRGDVPARRYLGVVLMHQTALSLCLLAVIGVAALVPGLWDASLPLSPGVAALLVVCTQVQDLARRYFFVTERPARAFACDLVAHGVRLVSIAGLALAGSLSIGLVWTIIIATALAGIVFLLPDLARVQFDRQTLQVLTLRHRHVGGWMLATMLVAWFSESGFALMVIGAVLGTAEVGAVRAVQNLVMVLNLLIQSQENFMPSTASQRLVAGGPLGLRAYLVRVGWIGTAGMLGVVALLALLAEPLMQLLYGHSVPDQVAILLLSGLFLVAGFLNSVVYAGLRALANLHAVFLTHVLAGIVCVALMPFAATGAGVLGVLGVMLLARLLMTSQMVAILLRRIGASAQAAVP
jgi:O-antigen/teichoic acid export membrane protein